MTDLYNQPKADFTTHILNSTVLVFGLPPAASNVDVVNAIFPVAGPVNGLRLPRAHGSNRGLGFAFILLRDETAAQGVLNLGHQIRFPDVFVVPVGTTHPTNPYFPTSQQQLSATEISALAKFALCCPTDQPASSPWLTVALEHLASQSHPEEQASTSGGWPKPWVPPPSLTLSDAVCMLRGLQQVLDSFATRIGLTVSWQESAAGPSGPFTVEGRVGTEPSGVAGAQAYTKEAARAGCMAAVITSIEATMATGMNWPTSSSMIQSPPNQGFTPNQFGGSMQLMPGNMPNMGPYGPNNTQAPRALNTPQVSMQGSFGVAQPSFSMQGSFGMPQPSSSMQPQRPGFASVPPLQGGFSPMPGFGPNSGSSLQNGPYTSQQPIYQDPSSLQNGQTALLLSAQRASGSVVLNALPPGTKSKGPAPNVPQPRSVVATPSSQGQKPSVSPGFPMGQNPMGVPPTARGNLTPAVMPAPAPVGSSALKTPTLGLAPHVPSVVLSQQPFSAPQVGVAPEPVFVAIPLPAANAPGIMPVTSQQFDASAVAAAVGTTAATAGPSTSTAALDTAAGAASTAAATLAAGVASNDAPASPAAALATSAAVFAAAPISSAAGTAAAAPTAVAGTAAVLATGTADAAPQGAGPTTSAATAPVAGPTGQQAADSILLARSTAVSPAPQAVESIGTEAEGSLAGKREAEEEAEEVEDEAEELAAEDGDQAAAGTNAVLDKEVEEILTHLADWPKAQALLRELNRNPKSVVNEYAQRCNCKVKENMQRDGTFFRCEMQLVDNDDRSRVYIKSCNKATNKTLARHVSSAAILDTLLKSGVEAEVFMKPQKSTPKKTKKKGKKPRW